MEFQIASVALFSLWTAVVYLALFIAITGKVSRAELLALVACSVLALGTTWLFEHTFHHLPFD